MKQNHGQKQNAWTGFTVCFRLPFQTWRQPWKLAFLALFEVARKLTSVPFYTADLATFKMHGIVTLSKFFWHPSEQQNQQASSHASTQSKDFLRAFLQMPNKYANPQTNLTILMYLDANLSCPYCLKCWELLDTATGVTPALNTRIRDAIDVCPIYWSYSVSTISFDFPCLCTSKTWETAFQVLNITVWATQ